ncbi:MAG: hypothetical protein EZS28_008624 [Streblomastix strix]|uniref:Uncharacterized protein n=1 Tax=Streblomastix strix TaxID=222440 RepID=A0A5J4WLZ9_9EUKA|nr:MAG: hypothetical protein EZS28_008624 [Streblomastix strix]
MDSVVGQLGTELVKSGIALIAQSIRRDIEVVIITISIVEGVGCKRNQVVRMDSGTTVVIDLIVIKIQLAGFQESIFQRDLELILMALSLACSQSNTQLVALLASSVPSPVLQ